MSTSLILFFSFLSSHLEEAADRGLGGVEARGQHLRPQRRAAVGQRAREQLLRARGEERRVDTRQCGGLHGENEIKGRKRVELAVAEIKSRKRGELAVAEIKSRKRGELAVASGLNWLSRAKA